MAEKARQEEKKKYSNMLEGEELFISDDDEDADEDADDEPSDS